jgi:hypothetical protein
MTLKSDLPQETLELSILKVVTLGLVQMYAFTQRLGHISRGIIQYLQRSLTRTSAVILVTLFLVALTTACALVNPTPVASQPPLEGVWEGQMEIGSVMKKRLFIRFSNEKGHLRAALDVPTSFTEGFPLRDLAVNAETIRFSIPEREEKRPESGEWHHLPMVIPDAARKGVKLEFEGKIEGALRDDPTFDDWVDEIAKYRREINDEDSRLD